MLYCSLISYYLLSVFHSNVLNGLLLKPTVRNNMYIQVTTSISIIWIGNQGILVKKPIGV